MIHALLMVAFAIYVLGFMFSLGLLLGYQIAQPVKPRVRDGLMIAGFAALLWFLVPFLPDLSTPTTTPK